ncbi:hypothetical protein OAT84_02400 [Gammaproteobacteria bacterium]|nr:hypothetical protein [Gammaproteobacteria bacterium]
MNETLFRISLSFFWRFCLMLPVSMLPFVLLTASSGSHRDLISMLSIYLTIFIAISATFFWLQKRLGFVFSFKKAK